LQQLFVRHTNQRCDDTIVAAGKRPVECKWLTRFVHEVGQIREHFGSDHARHYLARVVSKGVISTTTDLAVVLDAMNVTQLSNGSYHLTIRTMLEFRAEPELVRRIMARIDAEQERKVFVDLVPSLLEFLGHSAEDVEYEPGTDCVMDTVLGLAYLPFRPVEFQPPPPPPGYRPPAAAAAAAAAAAIEVVHDNDMPPAAAGAALAAAPVAVADVAVVVTKPVAVRAAATASATIGRKRKRSSDAPPATQQQLTFVDSVVRYFPDVGSLATLLRMSQSGTAPATEREQQLMRMFSHLMSHALAGGADCFL